MNRTPKPAEMWTQHEFGTATVVSVYPDAVVFDYTTADGDVTERLACTLDGFVGCYVPPAPKPVDSITVTAHNGRLYYHRSGSSPHLGAPVALVELFDDDTIRFHEPLGDTTRGAGLAGLVSDVLEADDCPHRGVSRLDIERLAS